MTRRLARRVLAAFVAIAAFASPTGGSLAALAGGQARTLPVAVCTTQGPAQAGFPAQPPSDKGKTGTCPQCVLCAGGADRPVAGPLPARLVIPQSAAQDERPAVPPHALPASSPVRASRARDPPSRD